MKKKSFKSDQIMSDEEFVQMPKKPSTFNVEHALYALCKRVSSSTEYEHLLFNTYCSPSEPRVESEPLHAWFHKQEQKMNELKKLALGKLTEEEKLALGLSKE